MKDATIGLLDDDPGMLEALQRLLTGRGYRVCAFLCPDEFLIGFRQAGLDCVIMDLQMPRIGGLEVQDRLKQAGVVLPVVFLTGEGDIPATVRAIQGGAVNFLTKPVDAEELLNAVRLALIESSKVAASEARLVRLREGFARLTPREHEVLCHVISGKLNKQIAADLGICEQTVKIHRMRITGKTGILSVAELVRAADLLKIAPAA